MRQVLKKTAIFAAASVLTTTAAAQQIANTGFKSVGRGWPLAADLRDYEMPGPTTRPLAVGVVMACPNSAYSETKTGRFHIPLSTATWLADTQFLPDFSITSNLKLRIDSFDGSVASGVIFGSFDQPPSGQAETAAIQGEMQFRFPFQVQ